MVEGAGSEGLIIRRQTFIVKNERSIDEVYNRESKVSFAVSLVFVLLPDTGHLFVLILATGQRHIW